MQGLLVNEHAVEQVERHAADAVANGAKVMAGRRRHALGRALPFGGVREAGLGREDSRHGIEEFIEIKYMLILQPTEAVGSGRRAPSFCRAM